MKIIIFDLFDTLLDKVWFDYNKGLEYLADKYFDQRLDKLTLYAEEYRRKRDLYVFAAGSCFKNEFEGDIYDVTNGGSHPVYRYAKPLFMGVPR